MRDWFIALTSVAFALLLVVVFALLVGEVRFHPQIIYIYES